MTSLGIRTYAAFDSLRSRDFRWFWLGRLASSATMEMGSVAQGWLAYQLTGSALAIGWVTAGRSIARLILSLYAGALADRIRKRQLLILCRGAMVINATAIALLIVLGMVRVWHLAAYSFLSGVISSFMMPAERAYMAELVGRKRLLNAISLTSVGMGLMGIFAASLAGFTIELFGVEIVYFAMAALYLGAVFSLSRLPLLGTRQVENSVWADLKEGVSYLRAAPMLLPLMVIAVVRTILGFSYRSLMPVYAEEVLQFDARGLGILLAAPSVGSLIGSFILASMGNYQGKGKLLLISGMLMGFALVAFSNTRHFALVLLFLMLTGAARNATMVANQTLVQVNCSRAFSGRVMAVYMMIMGLMPFGTIPAGAIADAFGVPAALTLQGGLMILIFGAFWFARSRIRDLP